MMADHMINHEEEITVRKTEWRKTTPPGEGARFQLLQDRSVVPQEKFFEGLQVLFSRNVLLHELKDIGMLRAELHAREEHRT